MKKRTGDEYRKKARIRLDKFDKEQQDRGYRRITVYISNEFREELDDLRNDHELTLQQAMEYIFNQYKETRLNKSITDTDSSIPKHPEVGSHEHLQLIEDVILNHHPKGGKGGSATLKEIAVMLNEKGIKTKSGRSEWKGDTVRSTLRMILKRKG